MTTIRFVIDHRFPPRVPEMNTDLYDQDMMRYDHIAFWNRPQWIAVPYMPTHKCPAGCFICQLWKQAETNHVRMDIVIRYANGIKMRGI